MGNPGAMNRRLTVLARTVSKDAAGGRVETWAEAFKVWAQLLRQSSKEAEMAGGDRGQTTTRFRIRYRSDIDPTTHRIQHGGKDYDIRGIDEEGIQDRLLLSCSAITGITT